MTSDAPRLNLHNRLTSVADSELSVLLASLSTLHLDPSSTDARFFRGTTNVRFSTALCYSRAISHLPNDAFAGSIWHNLAPSRCRSFLWLAHHSKINTHVRLRSRRANNSSLYHFCGADEDVPHLLLHCPRAQNFWLLLGIQSNHVSSIELLWSADFPGPAIPNQIVRSTITTCFLWNVWKCRNAKVFSMTDDSNGDIIRRCHLDLKLCASRARSPSARLCLENWSSFLLSM